MLQDYFVNFLNEFFMLYIDNGKTFTTYHNFIFETLDISRILYKKAQR